MTKRKNFIFVDLQAQTGADGPKPFDGMSAGTFTDMWGREIEFKPEEMATYAINTAYALESTRDSSGQVVGFPIDAMNHDNREAAGFITGVELSEDGSKLRFTPRWNEYGRQLIDQEIVRYFSPTVDFKAKVVMGGSLTNWPATRTANHEILLKPVELSAAGDEMFTPDVASTAAIVADFKEFVSGLFRGKEQAGLTVEDQPPAEQEEIVMTEPTNQVLPEITALTTEQTVQLEALVEQRAQLRFQGWLEQEQRKGEILEFTRTVTGKGLPVQADDLTAFLSSLTADQLEKAKALFSTIASTGAIDFEEHGHGKTLTGVQPLPGWAQTELRKWLAAGYDLSSFFTQNAAELGEQADYNLSEFEQEK